MNQVPALDNRAVSLLKSRNAPDRIAQIYIQRNLDAMASEWSDAQKDVLKGTDYEELLSKASFTVTGTTLRHTHSESQRFQDMRRWYGEKRKPLKVHNTQLYIAMNRLIFRLRYGFTELVKNEIAGTLEM